MGSDVAHCRVLQAGSDPVRFWVGLTDRDWYAYWPPSYNVDEVNFWQPSARKPADLRDGQPSLFKLHKRYGGWVVGGGYWAHFTVLPARLAWDVFGTLNGAATLQEMARLTGRHPSGFDVHTHQIGCVALAQPLSLPPDCMDFIRLSQFCKDPIPSRAHI